MKRFFKNILFGFMLCFTPTIECEVIAEAGLGIADAFKDLSEAELIKAIEESQKALVDLMENGTPEQKAEFERALTEIAEKLSPEDWKELQAIGEVYEKNNPYEAPKEVIKEAPTAVEKKPEAKPIPPKAGNAQFEITMKETLELIIKNIDHMFHILSAHRDLDHKLKLWEEKSSFQELKSLLIRLKKHINRLSNSSDPETKIIIDNLHAFKKDLEAENKRIALAQDDFGLENPMTSEQADHTLTRVTLVLSTGINNLLPSLTNFFKKHEPEALEEAKKKNVQKSKAKEHEKSASQRRPSSPYFSTAPSHSRNYDSYSQMPQRRHRPSDMNNGFHQGGNAKNSPQKEHKADFGGFNMNIKRGVISGGKAIPSPEKKKDEKDKDKKDTGKEEENRDNSDKNKSPDKVDRNKEYLEDISKRMVKNLKAYSSFTRNIQSLRYPILNNAAAAIDPMATLKNFAENTEQLMQSNSSEIEEIKTIISLLQKTIGIIPPKDLESFIKTQNFMDFEKKVQDYNKSTQAFATVVKQKQAENADLIAAENKDQYADLHKRLCELSGNITSQIAEAKKDIAAFKSAAKLPILTK